MNLTSIILYSVFAVIVLTYVFLITTQFQNNTCSDVDELEATQ